MEVLAASLHAVATPSSMLDRLQPTAPLIAPPTPTPPAWLAPLRAPATPSTVSSKAVWLVDTHPSRQGGLGSTASFSWSIGSSVRCLLPLVQQNNQSAV